MLYRLINGFAWLVAAAVVVFALTRTESGLDRRSKTVIVDGRDSGKQTNTTDSASSKSVTDDFSIDDNSLDALSEAKLGPKSTDAKPEAIALSDSAAQMISENKLTKALALLQSVTKIDTSYARGFYNLGVVNQRSNKYGAAIKAYQRAITLRPHYYEPAYNLGVLYAKMGNDEDAVEWLTKAVEVKRSKETAPAHYNLGLVYKRLGEVDKAEASYRKALRLDPGNTRAHFNLAIILMDRNQYKKASDELRKTIALGFPGSKALRQLGYSYSKMGNDSAAAATYSRAAVVDSDDVSTWFNLAIVVTRLDLVDSAISSYRRALAIDSNYVEAQYNLALLFAKNGQPDSAINHYREASRGNPSYTRAYYNSALIYTEKGELDSAVALYEKVVDLDADNTKALFNLGLIYGKLDNYSAAAVTYAKIVNLDPVNQKALTNLGSMYKKLGEFDSAFVYYNRLVGLTHSPRAYYNRAKASNDLENYDAAAKDYLSAIKKKPDYAKAYHNLALLKRKKGDLPEALKLMRKAIEFDADNWKSHWTLGQIYIALGFPDKAREQYTKAALAKPVSDRFWREYNQILEPKQ